MFKFPSGPELRYILDCCEDASNNSESVGPSKE